MSPVPSITVGNKRTGILEFLEGYDTSEERTFKLPADPATDSGLLELKEGELFTTDPADSTIAKRVTATATDTKHIYLCTTGAERYDVLASETVAGAAIPRAKILTDQYDTANAGNFVAQVPLTSMLIGGVGKWAKAAAGDPVFGICLEGPKTWQDDAEQAFSFTPKTVITVEVFPTGKA